MIWRALGLSAALAIAFLAGTFVPAGEAQGKRHFLRIDYMKIPPGQALRYRNLEMELWKPVHQLRVNKGYITSWRLYGHHFPGGAGGNRDYQYVTVTEFSSLQAMDQLHYQSLFQEAHGLDYDTEVSERTLESRTLNHTDLWALLDSVTEPQQ